MLVHWFQKHPVELSEKYAIKMMHKKLESIEKKLKENPDDESFLADLAKVYEMICHLFEEKGKHPNEYLG